MNLKDFKAKNTVPAKTEGGKRKVFPTYPTENHIALAFGNKANDDIIMLMTILQRKPASYLKLNQEELPIRHEKKKRYTKIDTNRSHHQH